MGALRSFFGLRPGFGFAGITHSLEAKKKEEEMNERERSDHLCEYSRTAHNFEGEGTPSVIVDMVRVGARGEGMDG